MVFPHHFVVIAAATWGGMWVLVRGVRAEFPPIAIAFWRWVAAAAIADIGWAAYAVRLRWRPAGHGAGVVLIFSGLYLI